jgi:hypothetical protein
VRKFDIGVLMLLLATFSDQTEITDAEMAIDHA